MKFLIAQRGGRALVLALAAVCLSGCGNGGGKPSKNDAVNDARSASAAQNDTAAAASEQPENAAKPLGVDTVKLKSKSVPCEDDEYSNGVSYDMSGQYPKISGLTDAMFQEKMNAEIKKQAEYLLSEGESIEYNTVVSFNVLRNDGEIFAAQLNAMYEPGCGGGNNWMTGDTMITIDVPNNKTAEARFSRGGDPLYPYSEVTMSVASINKIVAEYEHKDSDCDMSISDISKGTFVVADGYVAIEMFLSLGCAASHASVGVHAIPLYKAPAGKQGKAGK